MTATQKLAGAVAGSSGGGESDASEAGRHAGESAERASQADEASETRGGTGVVARDRSGSPTPIADAPRSAASPAGGTERAVVPVPGTRQQERRPSFWQRIGLRAAGRDAGGERVLERLDAIQSRVDGAERSLASRIQQLDDRFSEVWVVEEQLSQMNDLRATLEEIASRQLRLTEQLRGISRRMTFVTALVLAAAAVVVLSLLGL